MLTRILVAAVTLLLPCYSQSASSYVSRTIAGIFPIGDNASATNALLEVPQAVTVDANGNTFIADAGNGLIRKVSRSGIITSVLGYAGYAYDLKADAAGNLYIAGGNYAYKLTPAGVLSTIAGNGSFSFTGDGGPATSAGFNGIYAIAVDSAGIVYICDTNNHKVRKVGLDGTVSTIAGGGAKGFAGDNGPAANSLLNYPRDIAIDAAGNIYINDYYNNRVRKISSADGKITTFAGSGICCSSPDGGLATGAFLSTGPVTADLNGNVYIYDYQTSKVRKVSSSGILTTFAGDGNEGFAGDGSAPTSARFSNVSGLGTDPQGALYIADTNNERIRMVSNGLISTVVGRSHFGGDGGPATGAFLHRPHGVVTAPDGTIYFTDTVNHRVRRIGTDGKISTIAGTGDMGFSGDNGPAASAMLCYPDSIARDSAGNIYFVDQEQLRVRKITPAGIISTVAGNGTLAYSNDTRGALGSGFAYITGIALDSDGNLYLSEEENGKIKKIVPTGGMTTFAGTGGIGFGGDGGPALSAVFLTPDALAIDGKTLYVADGFGQRIRKIDLISGNISTVAGNGSCCNSGDGGPAIQAKIDPLGVVGDGKGGLWFTDGAGVRYVAADGTISRISGAFLPGFAGDDAPANGATAYSNPMGIALAASGDVILADTDNSRIRKLQVNNPTRMDIVSGDKQTGTTGTALNAMVVKLTGSTGVAAGGVSVNFAVTAGTADLSAKASVTDVNGQAGISATPTKAGTLTIAATFGTFTATFTATIADPVKPPPATDIPVIAQGGIGQNGFSVPAVQAVSAGAITTIYGSNFTDAAAPPTINTLANNQLGTLAGGVCVTFAGVKAPIFAVAATQITVEVPAVAPGSVPVQVLRNCGAANEQKSNVLTVTAQAATPEFLYAQVNADGHNPVAAVGTDGLYIAPPSAVTGARLAKAGDVLVIYALGLGATDPPLTTGVPPAGAAQVTPPVTITIGGVTLPAANIIYVGVTPGYIGLYQINLQVPSGIPSGNQPIVIQSGAAQSPPGAYLAMQ